MATVRRITPFLWFDDQAEQAATYYTGIFPNSRIVVVTRYTEAGQDQHRRPPGSVMTVGFELDGLPFTALNGGPVFRFNESVSFVVHCATQAEVDHYWERLRAGGDERAQQCGWLKDRYGLSWQVVPNRLIELVTAGEPAAASRVMAAIMKTRKIDIAALERAAAG